MLTVRELSKLSLIILRFIFSSTHLAKGRECNNNAECASIQDTSCVRDYDGKLRCLCGNFLAPTNGQCHAKLKGLRHQCRRTDDCEDYMVCRVNNSTKTTILSTISKDNSKKEMLCLCDEEGGYMENIYDKHCNGKQERKVFFCDALTSKTFLQPLLGISSPACSATLRQ
jgi:hypothetical protein